MANSATVEKAVDRAKDKAQELASEALEKTTETVNDLAAKTEDAIAANPYKSVLVAFGIGALLGVILSKR